MGLAIAPTTNPLAPELLAGDLIQPGHPLYGIIWINRERLSGAACFYGTRVPIKNLFDYIEGGEPLDDFLEGFPGVTREQAIAVLELAHDGLLAELPKPRKSPRSLHRLAAWPISPDPRRSEHSGDGLGRTQERQTSRRCRDFI